ncbi:MAG: type II CAAX endopeptidase family protein [Candidatus Bipolaricaulia bacterium]
MREFVKRRPVLSFSLFIVVWTWIFMAVIIALVPIDPVEGPQFVHVALVFFIASPSVFGFVFTRMVDGKAGVRVLLARAGRWRVKPIWYLASVLLIPAVIGLSVLIRGAFGESLAGLDVVASLAFAVPIALLAAVMEEFGWRGFMLPRLLERHGALKAALIVGGVWALWHAPINYLGLSKYGWQAVPILFVLAILPIVQTVPMVWIHNNAKQSILMMVLTHFSITGGFIVFALPVTTAAAELRGDLITAGTLAFAAIVIVAVAGAKRLTRSKGLMAWQAGVRNVALTAGGSSTIRSRRRMTTSSRRTCSRCRVDPIGSRSLFRHASPATGSGQILKSTSGTS